MTEVATNNVEMWTVVDVNAAPEKNESADHINNVDAKDAAKRMEETGSPTLINHEETQESLDTISAMPGLSTSGNSLAFNTKYEGPGTDVIANVTSVGDLREKVDLSWKNINVFVPQPRASICRRVCSGEKEDEPKIKQILFEVNGKIEAGTLLAVMGSSGAGKSTLMNVLAHRNIGQVQVMGTVEVNGHPIGLDINALSAYIQQEDLFIGSLTVREHLIFQALLRMDKHTPKAKREERVEEVMLELGLRKCADTVIGIPGRLRGISGGEKKRLAFASEVLTNPPLLFADEPTSGLDAFMAQSLIASLQRLAASGRTIMCTIHQPSSEVYAMFDSILLMAEGRIAYMGSTADAIPYFTGLGYPCPMNFNPADYFVHTLAIVPGDEERCKERVKEICDVYSERAAEIAKEESVIDRQDSFKGDVLFKKRSPYKASWCRQLWAVLWRSWITNNRDIIIFRIRIFQAIVTALIKAEGYVGRNISNDFTRGLNGWTVINEQGSDVTDQYAVPHVGEGHISVTAIGNEVLYVSAPAMYLGNLRSSYGQLFGFSFRVAAVEGVQVEPSDIILESEDGSQVSVRLNAQNNPIPNTDFQNYVFRLHEDPSLGWQPMLRGFDFQKLLTNLKAIKIRMNYGPQGTGLLDNVFLESALYDPRSAPELQVPWVENCTCPAPYTGKNCEQCSVGYTRQRGSDNRYGQCIPCQCYGHSDSCDPVTGVCSCQDNTVGDNCEKCKDGFYGNPTVGNKDDCKPCPCVFGSRCIQIAERVVCTDCPEGHTGDLCDYCQDGYHGDLLGSSIGCEKCNCSGNIEMNAIGNCDSLTGECIKCIYNTRNGPLERCELCAVGFYGNATHYPKPQCIACDCYTQGTVKPPDHNPEDPLPCDDKGRCSCKEKVIGDNCDSCQDTYWNVGSGNGCEQCLCDKTGSLNDSCDVITGQCPCKPGVSGRTCDQCQSDHFGFSDQGCQPCNCNPQGSLGESCDEYGVCSCKLGVLGIKCDSCEENKHNLTAGCIRCPACYNEIELLVNRLRINIRELVRIMDQFNSSSSGGIVVDPNFERRLKELKEAINNLLEKAEKSNSTDRALQEQLQVLTERVDKINEIMTDVINNTSVTEELISSALGNISEAEQSINRSRLMLDEAEKLLVDRGEKALNESILAAKSTSEQATRMAEIRNETSLLADKHENEADGVIENANEILNKSKQAVSDTEKVVTAQKKTTDGLEELLRKFNKTIQMHQQAANTADKSRGSSQSALDEANELFENGTAPLPEFGLQEMKAKINNSKAELAITSNSTEEILSDLETLVTTFAMKEEYVRKKMAEWPGLFETLQELLTNVTGANETAHNAIARGEETLKKAKDLLERLKKFNEIIDTSRAEADRAEANTTEIERLISSANNKSDEAAVTLETTENLARKAKTIAGEASETANRTGEKAKEIKEEAELLTIPEDNVTDPVLEATDELNDHKNTAAEEEKSIADALNKTKEAGEAAKNAREKIKEVHDRLMALLKEIEGLGSVNMTIMNRIKNQLQNETDLVRQLDREVSAVEKEREQIKNQIKEYTIDLTRYRAQKKLLQETYEKLPKVCPRTTPRPET